MLGWTEVFGGEQSLAGKKRAGLQGKRFVFLGVWIPVIFGKAAGELRGQQADWETGVGIGACWTEVFWRAEFGRKRESWAAGGNDSFFWVDVE